MSVGEWASVAGCECLKEVSGSSAYPTLNGPVGAVVVEVGRGIKFIVRNVHL